MFGHHYFGAHYFGPHYWGPGVAVSVSEKSRALRNVERGLATPAEHARIARRQQAQWERIQLAELRQKLAEDATRKAEPEKVEAEKPKPVIPADVPRAAGPSEQAKRRLDEIAASAAVAARREESERIASDLDDEEAMIVLALLA